MGDLADGESVEMQGSGSKPYLLKNTGGVYSCSCPAWRNQSIPIERRTCKHLRKLRGDAAEGARIGGDLAAPPRATRTKASVGGGAAVEEAPGPPLLLAHSWVDLKPQPDPSGWWLSEKLDGVRAWWDGRGFVSRLGNAYKAPTWFTAGLPSFPLDGELWVGRRQFQRCVSIVRRHDASELWREVRFVVFDAPALEAAFEERHAHCAGWFAQAKPAYAQHLDQVRCTGRAHLEQELARVEGLGGEGVMLRQPASIYAAGRSMSLLKVKSFRDGEARVVGHLPGAGRHKGRLGALSVELPDGTTFDVGTGLSDAERGRPPAVGSIITYRYQELSTDGVPRFPTYVGVREDAAWPSSEPEQA